MFTIQIWAEYKNLLITPRITSQANSWYVNLRPTLLNHKIPLLLNPSNESKINCIKGIANRFKELALDLSCPSPDIKYRTISPLPDFFKCSFC